MKSNRRKDASDQLGFNNFDVQAEQQSLEREEKRRAEFAEKKTEFENSYIYRTVSAIRTAMDDYFLDPIIGLFVPGFGDGLNAILSVPYVFMAVFKLKSIPLTLAIIYNCLVDCVVGTVPYIGDLLDFFHRSFRKNAILIEGFINRDEKVMSEVKRKSIYFAIMIALLCVAFYFVLKFAYFLATQIDSWFK